MDTTEDYYKTLTPDQRRALRALERALQKCADVGISLVGMDDNIFAAKDEDIDHSHATNEGFLIDQEKSITIDAPCYLDSGGW